MVTVKLFAVAKELAGHESLQVELAEESCIRDLRQALADQVPSIAHVVPQAMFAIEAQYASDATPLSPQCEVACIPPVSGG